MLTVWMGGELRALVVREAHLCETQDVRHGPVSALEVEADRGIMRDGDAADVSRMRPAELHARAGTGEMGLAERAISELDLLGGRLEIRTEDRPPADVGGYEPLPVGPPTKAHGAVVFLRGQCCGARAGGQVDVPDMNVAMVERKFDCGWTDGQRSRF